MLCILNHYSLFIGKSVKLTYIAYSTSKLFTGKSAENYNEKCSTNQISPYVIKISPIENLAPINNLVYTVFDQQKVKNILYNCKYLK